MNVPPILPDNPDWKAGYEWGYTEGQSAVVNDVEIILSESDTPGDALERLTEMVDAWVPRTTSAIPPTEKT